MPVANPAKDKLIFKRKRSSFINGFGNHAANKNSQPISNIGSILFTCD